MSSLDDAYAAAVAAAAARRGQDGCPPPDRAWAVALGLADPTGEERAHLRSCPRCRTTWRRLRWQVRHPSWWDLARATRGALEGDEANDLRRHLEGPCPACAARLGRLAPAAGVLFTRPAALPDPRAWAAASGPPLDQGAASPDGRLEAQLVAAGADVVLEVRTRDPGLAGHLAAGGCAAPDGEPLLAFAVLRPDVNGWYAAGMRWDGARLHDRLGGACRDLAARVVGPDLLTAAEAGALRESIARDASDATARAAWRAWAARALEAGGPPAEEIRAVLRELGPPS
jgi:hypothetical protein